jgi:hypothetical protein
MRQRPAASGQRPKTEEIKQVFDADKKSRLLPVVVVSQRMSDRTDTGRLGGIWNLGHLNLSSVICHLMMGHKTYLGHAMLIFLLN